MYLFGIDRAVQNTLPPGDYGRYFTLLSLGMLLQVVADAGLQLYNSRTISGHRQLLAKYFPYFLALKLLLGVAYFAALGVAGLLLGYGESALWLLLLVGTGQFLASLVLYLRSSLAGLGRYALDGWFSILDKALMILLIGSLLLLAPERLTVFVFAGAQVLCWLLTAGGLLLLLVGRLPRKWPRFRWATLRLLLRGGAPYALAILLQTAYTRLDVLMIERLLPAGPEAADHYAAGYRLLDAMNMVGWLLAGLLLPMYARLHARREAFTPLLRLSAHLLVGGALIVALPLASNARPVVELLYDFAEARTGHILAFLALTFVAQCLNYTYGALLSATGHIGRMNYVFGAGILLNVAGNLWALPRYGAAGAAAMTLATQTFVALVQAALAHRWLAVPAATVAWGRLLLLATGLIATTALLDRYPALPWPGRLAAAVAVGGLLSLVLGLLRPARLWAFFRA